MKLMGKVFDVNWIQLARDQASWNVMQKLIALLLRFWVDLTSNFGTKACYPD